MTRKTQTATVSINGRDVLVEWTRAAAQALERRPTPLIVELELHYACLVKMFVRFHDVAPGRATAAACDKMQLYFRAVTSEACSMDSAEALGGQAKIELDTDVVRRLAPKSVSIDHARGAWQGSYSF